MSETSLKDIIIWIVSVLLAWAVWYWFSDFWIDYKIAKNTTIITILTIIWFIWVPVWFWILWQQFENILLDKDNNIIMPRAKLIIYILGTLLVTCVTLWIMIWWKIQN